MRLKWWVLCAILLSALVSLSCRKTVAPNTDRNRAPETYLTAAPLDSVAGGGLSRVPYRFHAYWSGSDIDGRVVGYYIAVTETIPGARILLPPPKPQQWHYTTRTDSVFVFSVHEGYGTDRDHGLYVFAVDNEGKSDPTPAFTHFSARDRNLPGINWVTHTATGKWFLPAPGGGGVVEQDFGPLDLTDGQDPVGAKFTPRDTIPVGSAVYFGWTAYDKDWGSQILGYRYKLYESDYVKADVTGTSASYGTGVGPGAAALPLGLNLFHVRAVDEAGGTTFPDSLRRFVVNFDPETWWYGPDTTDVQVSAALQRDERGLYIATPNSSFPEALNKWLGPERFCTLPADRKTATAPPGADSPKGMRTFLEKVPWPTVDEPFGYRFYIHTDGDTVGRNADAVYFFAGGADKDSPYDVILQPGQPPPPYACIVGTPGPPNGSPIGFEFRVVRLKVNTSRTNPAFSTVYPNFNPLSGAITDIYFSDKEDFTGAGYAQTRAVDGNLGKDRRISDPINYITSYDGGAYADDPDRAALRALLLRFYINFNPYFLTDVAGFTPTPDTVVTSSQFSAHLFMKDPDPTTGSDPPPFTVRVRIVQPDQVLGRDEGWMPRDPYLIKSGESFPFLIPTDQPTGLNYFEFELSDLPKPGDGEDHRVVLARFPFYWQSR